MPTHFLYISPDASNEKTLEKLMKQKKKVVGCGLTSGRMLFLNLYPKDYQCVYEKLRGNC